MNILGIGGYSHDSAAALVIDGEVVEVVAAVAEERLTRVKHQGGLPGRPWRIAWMRRGSRWARWIIWGVIWIPDCVCLRD